MYSGPVNIQVNGGRQGDPRLPFLINRGRVLLGPMLRHSEARGSLGVQKDRYIMDDGSYAEAIATPYVNTIAIHLVTTGGEAEEQKHKEGVIHLLSFMGMRPPIGQDRGSYTGTPWHSLSPTIYTEIVGAEEEPRVSWQLYVGGRYDTFPVGNVTWFPERDSKTEALPFVVSWIGPVNRGFVVLDVQPQNTTTSTSIWISETSDYAPSIKITTEFPVIGVWVTSKNDISYPRELRYLSIQGESEAYVAYCYAWRAGEVGRTWELIWQVPLDQRVKGFRTSLMCNPSGTEGRILLLEITPDDYKIVTGSEGDMKDWDAGNLPAHIEAVFDLSTGAVTFDHEDILDYPYVEHDLQEDFDDPKLFSGVKSYYARGVGSVGGTFSVRVAYEAGTVLGLCPFKQMPVPGEIYATPSGSTIEVSSVNIFDPLPEGHQETTLQDDIDLMALDLREQVVNPASMQTAAYRGNYFGRSADISFNTLSTAQGESGLSDGDLLTYSNQSSGSMWFKWHRLQRRINGGRHIAAVDYDKDGNVVKAFLHKGERKSWFVGMACGPGIEVPSDQGALAAYEPPLPTWPWEEPPLTPIDWTTPQPVDAGGNTHNAYLVSKERIQAAYNIEIEGGQHNGKRIFLTNVERGSNDIHEGTGYTTSTKGLANSTYDWDRYDRKAVIYATRADLPDTPTPEYGVMPEEENKLLLADVDVEYLDLRSMLIVTNALSEAKAEEFSLGGFSVGGTVTAEPENIPDAVGAGVPNYIGFNSMTVCNDTANTLTNRVDRRYYQSVGALHAREPFEQLDPNTGEVVEADAELDLGLPFVHRVGVYGQKGDYAPASYIRSLTVCTATHSSQTRLFDGDNPPHKKRTYTAAPSSSSYRVGAGTGIAAAGASDPWGNTFASQLSPWVDSLPEDGPAEPTGSLSVIDGDEQDFLYMWDVQRQVRVQAAQWAEQWGKPMDPEQEALPEELRDPEYDPFDHATEVWYGAKVTIRF